MTEWLGPFLCYTAVVMQLQRSSPGVKFWLALMGLLNLQNRTSFGACLFHIHLAMPVSGTPPDWFVQRNPSAPRGVRVNLQIGEGTALALGVLSILRPDSEEAL